MALDDHAYQDLWSLPWDADLSAGTGGTSTATRSSGTAEPCPDVPGCSQLGPDALAWELEQILAQEEDLLLGACSRTPQQATSWPAPSPASLASGQGVGETGANEEPPFGGRDGIPGASGAHQGLAHGSHIAPSPCGDSLAGAGSLQGVLAPGLHAHPSPRDDSLAHLPSPGFLQELASWPPWGGIAPGEPGLEAGRETCGEDSAELPAGAGGGDRWAGRGAGDEGLACAAEEGPSSSGSGGAREQRGRASVLQEDWVDSCPLSNAALDTTAHGAAEASNARSSVISPQPMVALDFIPQDPRESTSGDSLDQVPQSSTACDSSDDDSLGQTQQPPQGLDWASLSAPEASAKRTRGMPSPSGEASSLARPWQPQESPLAARLAGVLSTIAPEKGKRRRGTDVVSSALIRSIVERAHEDGGPGLRKTLSGRGESPAGSFPPAESSAIPELDQVHVPLAPHQESTALVVRFAAGSVAAAARQRDRRQMQKLIQGRQGAEWKASAGVGVWPPLPQGEGAPGAPKAAPGWALHPCPSLGATDVRSQDLLSCPPAARRYGSSAMPVV